MDDNGTNHPGVQVDEMPDQAPEDGLNRHQRRAIKKMARLEREYEANPDASLAQARIMKKFTSLDRRLRWCHRSLCCHR